MPGHASGDHEQELDQLQSFAGAPVYEQRVRDPLRDTVISVGAFILIAIALAFTASVAYRQGSEGVLAAWRAYPAGTDERFALPAQEGGPCPGFTDGRCSAALDQKQAMDRARYFLKRGDAEIAIGNKSKAQIFYDWAVSAGRPAGALASRKAATRLQFINLTCNYDQQSLARIARDNRQNPLGGTISVEQQQRALRALAHYVGPVTGHRSRAMREAVRRFQHALWFDETGVLTPEQTVLAVCGAAEIGQDAASQNLLGIMYVTGLGVRQSTDRALQWYSEAARQNSADANWNLAVLFGTRTAESSVLVCDADQNAERADSFLKEACEAGHPAALRAYGRYQSLAPRERWRRISSDMRTPEALSRVGKGCNPNG